MSGWTSETLAAKGLQDQSYRAHRIRSDERTATGSLGYGNQEIAPHSERQALSARRLYLPVTPTSKPRMTQRDKWAKRPPVVRYHEYCDAVRANWPDVDNLLKALLDALHIEDKHIYHLAELGKYWAEAGYIEVIFNEHN